MKRLENKPALMLDSWTTDPNDEPQPERLHCNDPSPQARSQSAGVTGLTDTYTLLNVLPEPRVETTLP
ncbi:hypothetical protein SRHO_G00187890 [Serrasalmus rhombeus]